MLDGKNYMKTMESLEETKRRLDIWAQGQGIETEERNCIYCGKKFFVKKDSPQLWHSSGCNYINGPRSNDWGGQQRQYEKKNQKIQKRPLETHDEFGRLK